jgi:hypothetical protein
VVTECAWLGNVTPARLIEGFALADLRRAGDLLRRLNAAAG